MCHTLARNLTLWSFRWGSTSKNTRTNLKQLFEANMNPSTKPSLGPTTWRRFWSYLVKILVFLSPTGYMLASVGVSSLNLRYILSNPFEMIGNLHEVLNFNRLFLKLKVVLPSHCLYPTFQNDSLKHVLSFELHFLVQANEVSLHNDVT